MDIYEIRPHPSPPGYTLSGPALPHALWYREKSAAAKLAAWMLRSKGGRIVFRNSEGYAGTEHVAANDEDALASAYDRGPGAGLSE